LLLHSSLCPGDILSLSAALRDLHRSNPKRFLTGVKTTCSEIWDNNPYVTKFEEGDQVELIDCNYDVELNKSRHAPTHQVKGFHTYLSQRLGVPCEVTAFRGDIHLSSEELSWTNQLAQHHDHHGPFWIIVAGGKYCFTAKWWNPDFYQEVVDAFRGKIQFVQCGESRGDDFKKDHFHPLLKGVIDLVGQTNLRQFIRLMYYADGVICPVTFAMHLAAAMPSRPMKPALKPCVVINGGREPAHWEQYPGHQLLHTIGSMWCCESDGCWRSRTVSLGSEKAKYEEMDKSLCVNPMEVETKTQIPGFGHKVALPQCMQMIKSKDVIRAVERYFEGGVLRYDRNLP